MQQRNYHNDHFHRRLFVSLGGEAARQELNRRRGLAKVRAGVASRKVRLPLDVERLREVFLSAVSTMLCDNLFTAPPFYEMLKSNNSFVFDGGKIVKPSYI